MDQTKTRIYNLQDRTYRYALDVVRFLETLPHDYVAQTMGKQLLRSATSVGANVVEAKASGSKRDFANFYNHSLKSANESTFWLGLLKDAGKTSEQDATPLLQETAELSNILAASLLTMRGRRNA